MARITLFPTPLGACGVAWRDDAVIATRLPEDQPAATMRRLVADTGGAEGDPPAAIREAIRLMTALLEGETPDLSPIRCDMGQVDAFAAQVYAITRRIRPGATSTYGAIASEIGDLSLSRRVGQALGSNPIPIIVPCHRVVGADGAMVGFSADGGVEMKLRMLNIEAAQIGPTPGLFGHLPLAMKPTR